MVRIEMEVIEITSYSSEDLKNGFPEITVLGLIQKVENG